MGSLNDLAIKSWIKTGEHFEGRSDGDGLTLCWPERYAAPFWKFRYRYKGKQRVMKIGDYADLPLADARKAVKRLRAQVDLGHDVAGEKQERIATGTAKIEADRLAITVGQLADEFFERMILGKWKFPNIVCGRIEKDIKPMIGKIKVEDVKPMHIDALLQSVVKRGAPTVANDVLRWLRRMFDYAVKRHMVEINPAAAFDMADAGGKEESRIRALSESELTQLFAAMRIAKGFSRQNELTVKLLLVLAVRKMELLAAQWSEFDLDESVWHLPGDRTKTGAAIDISLPPITVEWLHELREMAASSRWVLPARKMQHRMIPHIGESTLGVALAKVKHGLPPFTVHDFRRTARSHLAALGVQPHIAERCLNHKLKGVEGIYDRYDYFEERKAALNAWAALLLQLETGASEKVVPIKRKR
jgi:integrase